MYPRLVLFIVFSFLLLLDSYVYQGVRVLTTSIQPTKRFTIHVTYWGFNTLLLGVILAKKPIGVGEQIKFILPLCSVIYATKLFMAFFLLLDDSTRGFRRIFSQADASPSGAAIARSAFLTKTGMVASLALLLILGYGIIFGAYNYKLHRVKVKLPHLPSSFHGLRIGQISDIHSGSCFNKAAFKAGVDLLRQEKPDLIFFTGDLVNNTADEIHAYLDIFDKVQAPLGVYAILGNHDYGDYVSWPSASARQKNLQALCAAHQRLGWHLLRNEHVIITRGSGQLAVIGVENWGAGIFSKYGRLDQAYRGTEAVPVKLLLSHDPTHWDAQVRPRWPDIDITFSGHTHGFQVGLEVGDFKWSPLQYPFRYKQWAGLYQAGAQYLYVNRGYGNSSIYPGRIGIWPEITIIELEKAERIGNSPRPART